MPTETDLWQSLARLNKLTFHPVSFPHEPARVSGMYRGYRLHLGRWLYGLEIILTAAEPQAPVGDEGVDLESILAELVKSPLLEPGLLARVHGYLRFDAPQQKLLYHQTGDLAGTKDVRQLQTLLKLLSRVADDYRRFLALGAEAFPLLQEHCRRFNPLVRQLVTDIAHLSAATQQQLSEKLKRLLCTACLVRFQAYPIDFLTSTDSFALTYYGCRYCRQSRNFIECDRVVAVLDESMSAPYNLHNGELRVNWLNRRRLFDFERVEIIRATDEAVERFAVQVGNNTDSLQQPTYRYMECLISPACELSANTRHILHRTFGQTR